MNKFILWFNQTGSPARFDTFAKRWAAPSYILAFVLLAIGIYGALFSVPADYKQGESFRILYVHVPAAWMSLMIFVIMAIQSAIALIWRIKICELIAMASAPIGAIFTLVTLISGAVWGKPTWGTWWTWDPRLTSELVMLFLYLAVIGLYSAIEDRRSAARAAGFFSYYWRGKCTNCAFCSELVEYLTSRRNHPFNWPIKNGQQYALATVSTRCRQQTLVYRFCVGTRQSS